MVPEDLIEEYIKHEAAIRKRVSSSLKTAAHEAKNILDERKREEGQKILQTLNEVSINSASVKELEEIEKLLTDFPNKILDKKTDEFDRIIKHSCSTEKNPWFLIFSFTQPLKLKDALQQIKGIVGDYQNSAGLGVKAAQKPPHS